MFEKIKTKKVYMVIVEQIQSLLKEGKLKPGDKLPSEQALTEKFGTSRASVREALSALEILGVTKSRAGKGNFIRDDLNSPSSCKEKFKELEEEESPFEILEARKAVETGIARLAANKATGEDITGIEKSLKNMQKVINNIPEVMKFNREFHINIAKAAHNNLLFSMMIYLADGLKEELWINLKEKSWALPGRPQKYIREHTEILKAIKNKDSESTYKKMYEHLLGVEKDLLGE